MPMVVHAQVRSAFGGSHGQRFGADERPLLSMNLALARDCSFHSSMPFPLSRMSRESASARLPRSLAMSSPVTPELPAVIQLPIVISPAAWQHAVLLESRDPPESLFRDRLRSLLCAAYTAHLDHPQAPSGDLELSQTQPQCPHLHFSLLEEPQQPTALLIALTEEYPR